MQSSLHNAKTLAPPLRSALEQLLGRALADNETVSIRAYQPHEGPAVEQQCAVAHELRRLFSSSDERTKNSSEVEQEEILDEAIRSVRPSYRTTG
jgi:hypothetical protein